MIIRALCSALALAFLAIPATAWADDPKDPAMRDRAARERDAAEVRRLNREQARYVQRRDAHYAEAQADYRRRMAEWRHAVRMCESGHYEYCQR